MIKPFISLILLIAILYTPFSTAAGVSNHLKFLARSKPENFRDYIGHYKVGAFFPDALYSCAKNQDWSDFAEDSHWPNFLLNGLKVFHSHYGDPNGNINSKEAKQFKAFLFGVLTHQLSDTSFHSLVDEKQNHGLIKVLSELEFDGDINAAHNFADAFGDFLGLSNMLLHNDLEADEYFSNPTWFLPNENDIMELLDLSGLPDTKITFQQLDLCVKRGLAAVVSEVVTMKQKRNTILSLANLKSPRAREFLQYHWMGGERDIIVKIQNCEKQFENFFSKDSDLSNVIEILAKCDNLEYFSAIQELDTTKENLVKLHSTKKSLFVSPETEDPASFGNSFVSGKFCGNSEGNILAVSAPLMESHGLIYLIPWKDLQRKLHSKTKSKMFQTLAGKDVAKLKYKSKEFLLISDPNQNSISFFHNGKIYLTITDSSPNSNNLMLGKVNDDTNNPTLFLCGPNYGENEEGSLIIVPSVKFVQYLENYHPNTVKPLSELSPIHLDGTPNKLPYQHFASTVELSTINSENKFLYITSQNTASVYIYLFNESSRDMKLNLKFVIIDDKIYTKSQFELLKQRLIPSRKHRMLGKTLKSWVYNDRKFVAISKHLSNEIFIFEVRGDKIYYYIKLGIVTHLEKIPPFVRFGSSIEYNYGTDEVYISASGSFNEIGAIWKVEMKDILFHKEITHLKSFILNPLKNIFEFNPQPYVAGDSNFGDNLLLTPANNLIIGVPHFNYGNIYSPQLTGEIIIDFS